GDVVHVPPGYLSPTISSEKNITAPLRVGPERHGPATIYSGQEDHTVDEIPGLGVTQTSAIPKLSGDIRPLIPKLGLRNYWYPAIADRAVGWRKPGKVTLLGEELCLFRGANGDVAAIDDVCPHRGARLSEGDCHYRGTVACPYHGWVFDESGKNVAVLSEGPD